MKFLQNDPTLK